MYKKRYRRIINFFARQLFILAVWDIVFPKIGLRNLSKSTRTDRLGKIATEYRQLAIEMGGVLIKVGQFLSSRVDVLPPEFTTELIGLQDEVPPVEFSEMKRVAEAEYGKPLEEKFLAFDSTPLAAASLGQVHRARIYKPASFKKGSGNSESEADISTATSHQVITVVVKIQRPHIEEIIEVDLSALRTVGGWLDKYGPIRRRADIPALLDEFTRTLYEEVDYILEGQNAETFANNFDADPLVRVPRVVWTHSTKRALTLENVWGIKITDIDAFTDAGVDRSDVASRLIDTYLKQIFEDGFFHADPHPGNLFVNPIPIMPPISTGSVIGTEKSTVFWQLTFVDFGMVGRIPEEMKAGLREMLIGIGTKDAARVIKSYQMMNILLPGADIDELEKAGAEVFELFWGLNMTELSDINPQDVIDLTKEYRHLLYALPIQVPQNIIFLGRMIGILSGLCTGLDPEFNLFNHIAPYAQKLVIEEARFNSKKVVGELGVLATTLFALPKKVDSTLYKLERGDIAVQMPEVTKQVRSLESAVRQVVWGIIFASLLLGGVQLKLAGEDTLGYILLAGALVSFVLVIFSGRKKQ